MIFRNLEIRKASLPYYKPYVIMDIDTNRILEHCDNMKQAQQKLIERKILNAAMDRSSIQSTSDPMKAHQDRMKNPFGEPKKPEPLQQTLGKRKVILDDE